MFLLDRKRFYPIWLEFLRYLCAGGIAFFIDFFILYFLTTHAGVHYFISATAAFVAGTVVNYQVSIRWVFETRAIDSRSREFTLFAVIGAVGVVVNDGFIVLMVECLNLHYLLAKLVATAVVVIFNFSLRKWLVFSRTKFVRVDDVRLERERVRGR